MTLEPVWVRLKKKVVEMAKIENFFSTGDQEEDRKLAHREAQKKYKKTVKGKATEKKYYQKKKTRWTIPP